MNRDDILKYLTLADLEELVKALEVIWNYRGGYGEISLLIRARKLEKLTAEFTVRPGVDNLEG